MGSVYRATYTKPIPAGAELFTKGGERFARWKNSKGRKQVSPVTTGQDGTDRLRVESPHLRREVSGRFGSDLQSLDRLSR